MRVPECRWPPETIGPGQDPAKASLAGPVASLGADGVALRWPVPPPARSIRRPNIPELRSEAAW